MQLLIVLHPLPLLSVSGFQQLYALIYALCFREIKSLHQDKWKLDDLQSF